YPVSCSAARLKPTTQYSRSTVMMASSMASRVASSSRRRRGSRQSPMAPQTSPGPRLPARLLPPPGAPPAAPLADGKGAEGLLREQPLAQGVADQGHPAAGPQLLRDAGAVGVHRFLAQAEDVGDFPVGVAQRDQLENRLFPVGEVIGRPRGVLGDPQKAVDEAGGQVRVDVDAARGHGPDGLAELRRAGPLEDV